MTSIHAIFFIAIINLLICQLKSSYQDEYTITRRHRKHALRRSATNAESADTPITDDLEFLFGHVGRRSKRTQLEVSKSDNPEAPVITTISPMDLDEEALYPAKEHEPIKNFAPEPDEVIMEDPTDAEILMDIVVDTFEEFESANIADADNLL